MHDDRAVSILGLSALAAVLVGMAVFLNAGGYAVAVAVVTVVVIVAVTFPLCRWLADRDQDPKLLWILLAALAAKLIFSLIRYWMVNSLYGGGGDSNRYDVDGWAVALQIRAGDWVPSIETIPGSETGTGQVIRVTGYLYALIGRSIFAAFFIYAWLAWLGCLMFVRGARYAFPELDHRRYLYLVMFWPSLLFWPSSIGKEALMVFLLGVASYGAFRLLGPKPSVLGLAPFVIGVLAMAAIRPHVALIAVLALVMGAVFSVLGGFGGSARGGRRFVRFVGLSAVVGLSVVVTTQASGYLSESLGDRATDLGTQQAVVARTQQGGSSFNAVVVTSPAQVPAAFTNVVFQPFLWTVRSPGQLVSSLEGVALAVLALVSWRRLRYWPGSVLRRPVLIYAAAFVVAFIVAFSSIANAGILARQRVQMLPLLLLAFAVPATRWWGGALPDEELSAEPVPTDREPIAATGR